MAAVVWYMPPNKLPSAFKKNPAMKFSNNKTCISNNIDSFFIPFPILIKRSRKMITVIISSGFINIRKSFSIFLFEY